jgi:AmmeMemoRadiSam system protein A
MSILRAYVLPHPPLAVSGVGRGDDDKIHATLASLDEVAKEIAKIAPETIIFITPHNVNYTDYFHISPSVSAKGDFSRFNAPDVCLEAQYDTKLAEEIEIFAHVNGISAGRQGEKDTKLDHGVMVPMWFINRRYTSYKALRVSPSGMDASEHYRFGKCIAEMAERSGRKTVIIASGDLSHKLSATGPYGVAPEGAVFDDLVTTALSKAEFLPLFTVSDELREQAAECGYNPIMIITGCLDCRKVEPRLYSYECPFGVGYAVVGFLLSEYDENRNFLEQYSALALKEARERKSSEDAYQLIARQSLEYIVKNGETLPLPSGLPDEMLNNKAGAFVSLHKNGRLRGCVGTITPTTDNIALEIIRNAVSAGFHDNRFEKVTVSELPLLTYKVDILSAPEMISGPEKLDVKRYGVIVSSGYKRGLLLPNLEGINTVEEQVAIARRKGGIPESAPIKLERFEVTRHE